MFIISQAVKNTALELMEAALEAEETKASLALAVMLATMEYDGKHYLVDLSSQHQADINSFVIPFLNSIPVNNETVFDRRRINQLLLAIASLPVYAPDWTQPPSAC